ncbi:NAD-dependent epimerase/dehydratase family protein [Candidatus Pelagibacter sp. Uisw_136]|uniref:NAD-dependent epimerase/dehydratase family protein n=1 Tax=Candidatus Pelagibacter sp. Uisw_136 TaxID=3230991 RepID=UPI0039ED4B34
MKKVFIIGGGGYVGSALVPKMLESGYHVTVYDLFIYGEDVLEKDPNLITIKGDVRNIDLLEVYLKGFDYVIHLACISNDPSFELNPELGKSINLDSFKPLVKLSRDLKIKRFIYASSSSVYGIKKEKNVIETLALEPLTDYSKFKVECEKILSEFTSSEFETVIIRPATVCGYAKRQRLDVVVNILTNLAFNKRKIKVFGGDQLRPNIHIQDMVNVYLEVIKADKDLVNGEIFNAGYDNFTVNDIALTVKEVIGDDIEIETLPTDDNRSYHVSSEKIKKYLNFKPQHTIKDAIKDLKKAFEEEKLPNSLDDSRYFNIKKMQEIKLK